MSTPTSTNFHPGKHATYVNHANDERAPLLFLSGGEEHLIERAVGYPATAAA